MSAIDDLGKAHAEMPAEPPTVDSWADKAWRNNCIVAEFDLEADGRFFALASQKVPMLKAERDAERAAWARLVTAERAEGDADVALQNSYEGIGEMGTDEALAAMRKAQADAAIALQALRDLGVDVAGLGVDVAQMLEAE